MSWWDKKVNETDVVACVGKSQMERASLSMAKRTGRNSEATRRAGMIVGVLRQFGPHKLGKRLSELGYDRLEYLNFLVEESRNKANPVHMRFAMFERLDQICLAIAGAHPKVADYMNLSRAGSFKIGKKKRHGQPEPLNPAGSMEDEALGKPSGSPFARFLEEQGVGVSSNDG
jgi:hypothetical protein